MEKGHYPSVFISKPAVFRSSKGLGVDSQSKLWLKQAEEILRMKQRKRGTETVASAKIVSRCCPDKPEQDLRPSLSDLRSERRCPQWDGSSGLAYLSDFLRWSHRGSLEHLEYRIFFWSPLSCLPEMGGMLWEWHPLPQRREPQIWSPSIRPSSLSLP